MLWVLYGLLVCAALYLAIVAAMYFAQARLIFPTYLSGFGRVALPPSAERLEVAADDGTLLAGVRLPAAAASGGEAPVLLGFGGNVWNVESMALLLHRLFPAFDVVSFHYRGYRPSGGSPSARGVLADALVIYDFVQETCGARRVVAMGFSIGTPVAAYLARHRCVAGVVLVTPFDSLVALAQDHFPWLPVRRLLRHRLPTVDFIRDVTAPTSLIVAGRDSVVPARRSEPLRAAIPNLVYYHCVPDAEHDDLYGTAAFPEVIQAAVAATQVARVSGKTPGRRSSEV